MTATPASPRRTDRRATSRAVSSGGRRTAASSRNPASTPGRKGSRNSRIPAQPNHAPSKQAGSRARSRPSGANRNPWSSSHPPMIRTSTRPSRSRPVPAVGHRTSAAAMTRATSPPAGSASRDRKIVISVDSSIPGQYAVTKPTTPMGPDVVARKTRWATETAAARVRQIDDLRVTGGHPSEGRRQSGIKPSCYITERLSTDAGRHVRRPGRPDPPGDPGPAGRGRGHGDRTGRPVRDEPAGHLQTPQGPGEGGSDHPGRDAQRRPCRLAAEPLREATEWLAGYREYWEARYRQLDAVLEGME